MGVGGGLVSMDFALFKTSGATSIVIISSVTTYPDFNSWFFQFLSFGYFGSSLRNNQKDTVSVRGSKFLWTKSTTGDTAQHKVILAS